ncbi:unnamed protein product [Urochloa humidicola]
MASPAAGTGTAAAARRGRRVGWPPRPRARGPPPRGLAFLAAGVAAGAGKRGGRLLPPHQRSRDRFFSGAGSRSMAIYEKSSVQWEPGRQTAQAKELNFL